ncbi:MAG: cadmium-translocating P-type ATPase [Clostridia bacterium]|nr:cadmium-translocating P-type ATPase [Clostridia bacterium]
MKTVINIRNLDCPNCAAELEEELKAIDGVYECEVLFTSHQSRLNVEASVLPKVKAHVSSFEEVEIVEDKEITEKTNKKTWIFILISLVLAVFGVLVGEVFSSHIGAVISAVCCLAAYFLVGHPVLLSTVKNLSKGRIFDENFLMTVASLGAFLLGEYYEAVAVMLLYQIGEELQSLAVARSRRSIKGLMELKTERAYRVLENGGELEEVEPTALKVGDIVLVKTGEKIPADGKLLSNVAVLNVQALTGESLPIEKNKGEEILSGSINAGAVISVEIVREYEESAVSKILELVENAPAKKSSSEKFITTFAKYYTPIVCALAAIVCLILPIIEGVVLTGGFAFVNFERWCKVALTFLVVSCPCALVISVPLTYFCGVGACAKKGALIKGATHLDVLATAKTVAFDKTGTLTHGNFAVLSAVCWKGTKEELLETIACVEKGSSHPVAKAFEKYQKKEMQIPENHEEIAGKGMIATLAGKRVCVGNERLLEENGIAVPKIESTETLVFLAVGNEAIGYVEVGDELRAEAKEVIEKLRENGVQHTAMLTGDNRKRAEKVASSIGIDELRAELLPQSKLSEFINLKSNFGGDTLYVGDGVNDAPVMASADCAVSMGKLGSAAAIECSDVVLITEGLSGLVSARKIARKTRKIVRQNIVFSLAMKIGFMVLATLGILPLWLAVFADVGVMLIAVLNGLRVLKITAQKR